MSRERVPESDFIRKRFMSSVQEKTIILKGEGLTIEDVNRVARHNAPVKLTDDPVVWRRVDEACSYVRKIASAGEPVYGVTTGFGGMANVVIPPEQGSELQNNLLHFMHSGAGGFLPREDVRASMLLRANSHLKGASGVRRVLIDRIRVFLNEGVTPRVRELGSIGASGDLAPLTSITGSLIGVDPCFTVDFRGETMDAVSALRRLGLEPIDLQPKEGLAMINGTSVMTGIAANCISTARRLLALHLGAHALIFQALHATNQGFNAFIHQMKPHPGQQWTAAQMVRLLDGSLLSRDELDGHHDFQGDQPIQDRYSLRCMPQYMGPIVDGLASISHQIETEINCANDNPIIDFERKASYHAGNFLGQYVGVAMDHFRYYLGLMAKHLDVQISLLVAPEFNNGLSASLVGNRARKVNMGLKGLQICGNSIMPLLTHHGNSLVDRFPTHAEQFNQNVNSQGFGSANLARRSVELALYHLSVALLFGVQGVDLRTFERFQHYDARDSLSPSTRSLYLSIKDAVGRPPNRDRPLVYNDNEQSLEDFVEQVAQAIADEGPVVQSMQSLLSEPE